MTRNVDLSVTFVYVIDESLGMSKGKIAAQVSHVAMELADEHKVLGRAIVLKADHETFVNTYLNTMSRCKYILDAGLTEVPSGTMTCIGFKEDDYTKQFTKGLKLV
jgi:peptidyl-tRNA hydrolase